MKNKLLTIGEFSKRTGCSIKSLRYYDSIGLLKPAYIDYNNYRYYNFEQTRMAELIQICVGLSIPLKEVKDLVFRDEKIDYKYLIEYGKKITKEKIAELNEDLEFLNLLQENIERIDSYDDKEQKEFYLNEKYYYTIPLYECEMNDKYYELLGSLFEKGFNQGLYIKHDYGVIINIKDDITTKFVAFKTAVKEMLWIYRDQSNDVTKLQEQNVHIWDEWVDENNTIGRGYGYQIAKFNQIDKLIETLKTNPQDRRMLMTMWNIEDLPHMTLQPCCFMTLWDVTDGKLNCMLIQRSGDIPLGVPFNTSQYAVLVHLIAQVTGLKPGLFTHVINNAHIYENQVEGMKLQLTRANDEYEAPKLWINPEITNFYDFTADDIKLIDYKYHPAIKMEVSV